jgi:protein-S-isoprenylcysteine O-methyltransferase Ste14
MADWVVNGVVLMGVGYLSFVMALAGWFAGLRRGEAVTLLPDRGGRTGWGAQLAMVIVGLAVSLVLLVWLWIPLPLPLAAPAGHVLEACGLALFITGALMIVWARTTLGRMWGISTSREVKLLADHQLVDAGPYRLIRHPMYFGWWVALLGTVLIYRTWILVLLLGMSLVVFYRRARLEEKTLAERFGPAWKDYVARTRFLVPFIY